MRSKILQTLHDKKLCQEAMVKRYTLKQLLEHAANKEDIHCQSQHMEETLPSAPLHKIRPNPKDKLKPKLTHNDKKRNSCQRAPITLPTLWENMQFLHEEGSFCLNVQ